MSPEELDRAMALFLKNQAAFDARLAAFDARLAALAEAQSRSQRLTDEARDTVMLVASAVQQLTVRADATEVAFKELAAAQKETEERLNHFIVVVEKYIASHGNGNHPPA